MGLKLNKNNAVRLLFFGSVDTVLIRSALVVFILVEESQSTIPYQFKSQVICTAVSSFA